MAQGQPQDVLGQARVPYCCETDAAAPLYLCPAREGGSPGAGKYRVGIQRQAAVCAVLLEKGKNPSSTRGVQMALCHTSRPPPCGARLHKTVQFWLYIHPAPRYFFVSGSASDICHCCTPRPPAAAARLRRALFPGGRRPGLCRRRRDTVSRTSARSCS
jgi:hypothetical protein